MKLIVLILNKVDTLEFLLEDLSAAGVKGATILQSQGMAMTLAQIGSSLISNSIRALFSSDDLESRTILIVAKEEQVPIIRKIIYHSVGDLKDPNTGILFTVPVDFIDGLPEYNKEDKSTVEESEPSEQTEENV